MGNYFDDTANYEPTIDDQINYINELFGQNDNIIKYIFGEYLIECYGDHIEFLYFN